MSRGYHVRERIRRFAIVALLGLFVVGCGTASGAEPTAGTASGRQSRLPKPGKLTTSGVFLKFGDGDGAPSATVTRELAAIVEAVRVTLASRPGTFAPISAAVIDNASLAAQNPNPDYAEMLATWGRETGAMTAFELQAGGGPALLRVSMVLSRYSNPTGAHAAYQYVIRQQDRTAKRLDVERPPPGRPTWDEAVVFFQETSNNGRVFGQYTLILRTGNLIGFVTNVGVGGQVSARDTALFAQALLVRIRDL